MMEGKISPYGCGRYEEIWFSFWPGQSFELTNGQLVDIIARHYTENEDEAFVSYVLQYSEAPELRQFEIRQDDFFKEIKRER